VNILSQWLRTYVPKLSVSDRQLADDLTLRGIAVEGVHDLGGDNGSLFEMDITTNRVDAMNHYGVAREAATIYDLPLLPLDTTLADAQPGPAFPVAIEAPELCGRFTARVLRGVTIAPSSGQVADYFSRLGLKPISNAVDASNFVLHGMGHPTHAFDLDKIEGGIVIRLARKGERL
jgi:phenylalanyl-tRNA synthetase beta chain